MQRKSRDWLAGPPILEKEIAASFHRWGEDSDSRQRLLLCSRQVFRVLFVVLNELLVPHGKYFE
jgi:hypothetical protein